jgi:hypothetical protein
MSAGEVGMTFQNLLRVPDDDGLAMLAAGAFLIALVWLVYAVQRLKFLNRQLRRFDEPTTEIAVARRRGPSPALAGAPPRSPVICSDDLNGDRAGYIRLQESGLPESTGAALAPVRASAEVSA